MKKWKAFLSMFVLLAAIGAGTIYYFLNVKEYETKDTKVEEIVDSNFDIDLPEESSEETPEQAAPEAEEKPAEVTEEAQTSTEPNTDIKTNTTSNKSSQNAAKKVPAASIIAKYQPSFASLESQASAKLDSLLSYAISEYNAKQANNEDISYFYFYNKYNAAAKKLEASTDASFNYIYSTLVKELKAAGYSASEAQPIQDHYNAVKKERRSAIVSKARSYVNL